MAPKLEKKNIFVCCIFSFMLYYNMKLYKRFSQFLFRYCEKSKNGVEFLIVRDALIHKPSFLRKKLFSCRLQCIYRFVGT